MEAMRQSWTDERLDDFREDVGRRFDEVDRRFEEVDRRFDKVDERMEAGFARMDAKFDAINAKFDALMRALFQVGFILVAALIGLIATQL